MRAPRISVLLTLCSAASIAGAQTMRDSAGIRIVDNPRPTWRASEQLRVAARPTVVIGDRDEEPYLLSRIPGAARLSNGNIVVAEDGSAQLRFFDPKGTYLRKAGGKGGGPGEMQELHALFRASGDTIVAGSPARYVVMTGDGSFVRSISLASVNFSGPRGLHIVVGAFADQSLAVATAPMGPQMQPNGRERWIQEAGLHLVERTERSTSLGSFPVLEQDTYAETVPAFSQMIVDAAGRLWVREPNLADAPGCGCLNELPAGSSTWSVFDAQGRWLGDVEMPRRFRPFEIGVDYILGRTRSEDDVPLVALYRLTTGG
jgi:hypothetical protein